jgi:hydroxymethylbilane synthase
MRAFVLATRGSALAMAQSRLVQALLEQAYPDRRFELLPVATTADRKPDQPLATLGEGEGVFVKELESALLDERADAAVHSLKDLPLDGPDELQITAILGRDEPRDALVARSGSQLRQLPAGSRIGTSSLRRRSQLLHARQDLTMVDIRGNVDTRLRKLDEGRFDAIVVAACGLIRLGRQERITERLPFSLMLPEPGQGALAVQTRTRDAESVRLVQALDAPADRTRVSAERALLRALGGGCHVPIAAHASLEPDSLHLDAAVVAPDGSRRVRERAQGDPDQPEQLGRSLGDRLIRQGALDIIAGISRT